MKAIFSGVIVAETSTTHQLDGYYYFPPSAVRMEYLERSDFTTRCPAKGGATYWNLRCGDNVKLNAAFSYPEALPAAKHVQGWIGFWTTPGSDDVVVVP